MRQLSQSTAPRYCERAQLFSEEWRHAVGQSRRWPDDAPPWFPPEENYYHGKHRNMPPAPAPPTPDPTPQHPGAYWRRAIWDAKLTQASIADDMGISRKHLSRIVNGHQVPNVVNAYRFAIATGQEPEAVWRQVAKYQLAMLRKAVEDGGEPTLREDLDAEAGEA